MNKIESSKLLTKKDLKLVPGFDNHFLILELNNPATKLHGYIAIHRKNGTLPSFGATRLLKYPSDKEALKDVLKLSKLMSYKSALAGLPYGGAKAVLIKPKGKFSREALFKSYATILNSLKGQFITGTDVGLTIADLESMKNDTEYLVGYFSNPEKYTALGLFFVIETTCQKIFGTKSMKDRTFAIQGVGKVGSEFLKIVYKDAKSIYISDTNKERLSYIKKLFPKVKIVDVDNIHKQKVDVYMPCALYYTLNKKSIGDFKCKIIIGSANNQLESADIADKLYDKGIFYGPDYIVNSGGLISVVDEYKNSSIDNTRIKSNVKNIQRIMSEIIKNSEKENKSPERIADKLAKKIINKK